jgi:hypothetical protein
MLIDTRYGILNIFLEPQFLLIGSDPLYTVQASDARSFRLLELPSFVEYRMDPKDLLFPFTGFAYAWHLEHLLSAEKLALVPHLADNINPEPAAYCWESSVSDLDFEIREHDDYEWADITVGFCLKDELSKQIDFQSNQTQWFRAYPIYRLPTNEELSTVWTCQRYDD